jgi:hypothetical protein
MSPRIAPVATARAVNSRRTVAGAMNGSLIGSPYFSCARISPPGLARLWTFT